jgi:hypothetical protein
MNIKEFWELRQLKYRAGSVKTTNGRVIPIDKLFQDWVTMAEDDITSMKNFETEITNICADSLNDSEFVYPTVDSSDALIDQCFNHNEITFDSRGSKIFRKKVSISFNDLEILVTNYNDQYTEETPKESRKTYNPEVLKRSIKYRLMMLDLNKREGLKKDIIIHDAECEIYLNRFLRYVVNTFEIEGDVSFNVAMIKHWMWQTKRYVLGLSVKSPIFVNFYGEDQETGKTKFIEQLTRNLKDYRVGITLSDMLDDRKAEVWTKNYVTVADELKLGDVAGKQLGQIIAVIKNVIYNETEAILFNFIVTSTLLYLYLYLDF